MIKANDGIVYRYEVEEEARLGEVIKISNGTVYLDNGDEFGIDWFNMEAQNSNNGHEIADFDELPINSMGNKELFPDIKLDRSGMPILGSGSDNEENLINADEPRYVEHKVNAYKNPALADVFKKSKKEKKKLTIEVEVEVLDSGLVKGLKHAMEGSFDDVIQFTAASVDQSAVKDGIKQALEIFYQEG